MQAAYSKPPQSNSENSNPASRKPVVQASTRQTLTLMREALRPLTVAGRDGELTFAEIAEQLGISAVRARELYLKGMNKLRCGLFERQL